jgi:hypothetical protein
MQVTTVRDGSWDAGGNNAAGITGAKVFDDAGSL